MFDPLCYKVLAYCTWPNILIAVCLNAAVINIEQLLLYNEMENWNVTGFCAIVESILGESLGFILALMFEMDNFLMFFGNMFEERSRGSLKLG